MNQLAIIDPITSATIPKPTKTEVIEALVRLKCAELKKEINERKEKVDQLRKKLEPKILSLALKQARKTKINYDFGYPSGNETKIYSVDIRIEVNEIPDDVRSLLLERWNLDNERVRVDEASVRKSIRNSMI